MSRPLWTVMLVLLIIFIITIRVILHQVPLELAESDKPRHADQAGKHYDRGG